MTAELRLHRREFPRAVELHGEGHRPASFPFSRPSERPNSVSSERFFVTAAFVGEKRSIGYGQRRREFRSGMMRVFRACPAPDSRLLGGSPRIDCGSAGKSKFRC